MSSTIQIRVDDDLKTKSDSLFKDLGTDTTSAIRMFLAQAVANNGFPFEIKRRTTEMSPYAPLTEAELLDKLSVSRNHASEGKLRDAENVVADMRTKYGL